MAHEASQQCSIWSQLEQWRVLLQQRGANGLSLSLFLQFCRVSSHKASRNLADNIFNFSLFGAETSAAVCLLTSKQRKGNNAGLCGL